MRGPEEVHSLMQLGKKRLIFAETKMNRTSSRFGSRTHIGNLQVVAVALMFLVKLLILIFRSHSVCILSIERSSKHSGEILLYAVDFLFLLPPFLPPRLFLSLSPLLLFFFSALQCR